MILRQTSHEVECDHNQVVVDRISEHFSALATGVLPRVLVRWGLPSHLSLRKLLDHTSHSLSHSGFSSRVWSIEESRFYSVANPAGVGSIICSSRSQVGAAQDFTAPSTSHRRKRNKREISRVFNSHSALFLFTLPVLALGIVH